MSIIKEGWIEKKGQTFMAGYRKRWLVLYSDKTLKYFEDTYYEILKGSIDISEASNIRKCSEASKNWKFGWEIVTPNRSWYFSSKSEYARKQWIQHVQNTKRASAPPTAHIHKNRSLQSIAKQQQQSGGVLRDQSPNPLVAVHSDSSEYKSSASAPKQSGDHFGDTKPRTTSLEVHLETAKENMSLNAQSKLLSNEDSNKKLKSEDGYTPGMYSQFGSNTAENAQETQSQFGKEYKYLSSRSMSEVINKRVNLSIHKQQRGESVVTNEDRFKWQRYQSQIDDLIHDDENMADDVYHRLDDLKCFCGGHLQRKKCDEQQLTMTCQVMSRYIFSVH